MNNTINVNYMTRAYSNFLKNNEVKGGKHESPSFCDRVAEKSQNAGSLKNALFFNDISETGRAEAVSAKDINLSYFKEGYENGLKSAQANARACLKIIWIWLF